MNSKQAISYWLQSAEEDKKAATDLFIAKHYHWSLFLWHLSLEKLFKARIAKLDKEVPYTHSLALLAKKAEIVCVGKQEDQLKEITSFNLEARYDDYKRTFYKKATQTYAKHWIAVCQKWYKTITKTL